MMISDVLGAFVDAVPALKRLLKEEPEARAAIEDGLRRQAAQEARRVYKAMKPTLSWLGISDGIDKEHRHPKSVGVLVDAMHTRLVALKKKARLPVAALSQHLAQLQILEAVSASSPSAPGWLARFQREIVVPK